MCLKGSEVCLKGSEQNVDSGSRSLKVILPNPPAQVIKMS